MSSQMKTTCEGASWPYQSQNNCQLSPQVQRHKEPLLRGLLHKQELTVRGGDVRNDKQGVERGQERKRSQRKCAMINWKKIIGNHNLGVQKWGQRATEDLNLRHIPALRNTSIFSELYQTHGHHQHLLKYHLPPVKKFNLVVSKFPTFTTM